MPSKSGFDLFLLLYTSPKFKTFFAEDSSSPSHANNLPMYDHCHSRDIPIFHAVSSSRDNGTNWTILKRLQMTDIKQTLAEEHCNLSLTLLLFCQWQIISLVLHFQQKSSVINRLQSIFAWLHSSLKSSFRLTSVDLLALPHTFVPVLELHSRLFIHSLFNQDAPFGMF